MSVVCAKYFDDVGWVIGKNRDCDYKPSVRIRKSFRRGIERLYLWDEQIKYAEGINEYGVGIDSVSLNHEEREIAVAKKITTPTEGNKKPRRYYSPDGLRIRTALFEINALNAVKKLIEQEIPGNTIVADKKRCFVLEAGFIKNGEGEKYIYKAIEIPQNKIVVRTEHGIMLPWNGYSSDVVEQKAARNASEVRYKFVSENLCKANTLAEILDVLSDKSDPNPQLNPLRLDESRGVVRTTGQLILVPGDNTLHYRPIWCDTVFDLETLNKATEKTFFEIVSTRKLVSFKEKLKERR